MQSAITQSSANFVLIEGGAEALRALLHPKATIAVSRYSSVESAAARWLNAS
jgi:hypothetical protein